MFESGATVLVIGIAFGATSAKANSEIQLLERAAMRTNYEQYLARYLRNLWVRMLRHQALRELVPQLDNLALPGKRGKVSVVLARFAFPFDAKSRNHVGYCLGNV